MITLPGRRTGSLGARFALVTAAGLLLAGVGILVVVDRTLASQAERQAAERMRTTAAALLDRRLRPADLERRLAPARRRHLRALLAPSGFGRGALGATLYTPAATLAVTSLPEPRPPAELLARARAGTTVSRVTSAGSRHVLQTFVPVRVGGRTGVLEVDQDYGPVVATARRTALVVAGILEALLVALCAVLWPGFARASTRLRRQVERLDWLASHDELTGALNRAGFRRLVAEALAARPSAAALLVVDVDRFQEINETIGADQGDALLLQVAARLHASFPERATARLGEDEFGILLQGAGGREIAAAGRAVHAAFADPVTIGGVRLGLDVRIGAARYPGDGDDADTLLRHASVALTRAKSDDDRIAVYEESFERDPARLALVGELRDALREGSIVLHYQPQVALRSGRVCAAEALVRWQHPQLGLLGPAEFIGAVEQSALLSELGRHALRTSIEQWRRWHEDGITIDVAVNLSTIDLLDVTLPGTIVELLLDQQMPADHLVLEITERSLLRRGHKTEQVLRRLEHIGASLAIDDFGTGYSSLAALRELPVTQVKIDRSFVAGIPGDVGSDEIVRSTIQLAHALGASVVAEGVETETQLRRLALLGCDAVQGFLLGRPQPPDRLPACVHRYERASARPQNGNGRSGPLRAAG